MTTDDGETLVPSGLFAYYSCTDQALYLNVSSLDLDQDLYMGIQCLGGEWDTASLPTDANTTCISEPSCKPADYQASLNTFF